MNHNEQYLEMILRTEWEVFGCETNKDDERMKLHKDTFETYSLLQ